GESEDRSVGPEGRPRRGDPQAQGEGRSLPGTAAQIGNGDASKEQRHGADDGREARFRGAGGEAQGDAHPLADVEIGEGRRAPVEWDRISQTGSAEIAEGGESRGGREQSLV